jgi:hypothetical protein
MKRTLDSPSHRFRFLLVAFATFTTLAVTGPLASAADRERDERHAASKPAPRPAAPVRRGPGPVSRPAGGNERGGGGERGGGAAPRRSDAPVRNENKNVHVNVDNSRHTTIRNTVVVRPGPRPYGRPPYRYGGYRYYSYHPYYYHPYRPHYYGPAWHPWGFAIAALAVTAIVVSADNREYHYDQGVWYEPAPSGGYVVAPAPVGATVTTIPPAAQPVVINETTTNNYYYGGAYYEQSGDGYKVVAPTAGSIVESLPEGGEEVTRGDQKYVKVGDTYYLPTQKDGKDVYEVVQIESDESTPADATPAATGGSTSI